LLVYQRPAISLLPVKPSRVDRSARALRRCPREGRDNYGRIVVTSTIEHVEFDYPPQTPPAELEQPRTLRAALAAQPPSALVATALLVLAGAMPVSAIPIFVLDWLPMNDSAPFIVAPLALVAISFMLRRTAEGIWAARGAVAGLAAVLAYDTLRLPLVWTDIWPDFIPRLGGWVSGQRGSNTVVGYLWRYFGDGAGIGLAYFVFCGLALAIRPQLIVKRPVLASVGYGVLVWAGLMATVALPARGEQLLFHLTPSTVSLSLTGHLIYGAVLGLFLRHHLSRSK
jgi:hypothetical protein